MTKNRLKIYWIDAEQVYPVCDPGAVVIAYNSKIAFNFVKSVLQTPKIPVLIGYASSQEKKERIVVCNNSIY